MILLQKKTNPAAMRKRARIEPVIDTGTTTGSISGDAVVFGRGDVTVDADDGVVVVSVVTVVNVVVTFLGAGVVLG